MRKLLQLQVDVQICAHTCECIRMYGARMQYAYHLFPDSHSMVFAADAKCGYVICEHLQYKFNSRPAIFGTWGANFAHKHMYIPICMCVCVCVCVRHEW